MIASRPSLQSLPQTMALTTIVTLAFPMLGVGILTMVAAWPTRSAVLAAVGAGLMVAGLALHAIAPALGVAAGAV